MKHSLFFKKTGSVKCIEINVWKYLNHEMFDFCISRNSFECYIIYWHQFKYKQNSFVGVFLAIEYLICISKE